MRESEFDINSLLTPLKEFALQLKAIEDGGKPSTKQESLVILRGLKKKTHNILKTILKAERILKTELSVEFLAKPEIQEQIRRSEEDIAAGRLVSGEELKESLGLVSAIVEPLPGTTPDQAIALLKAFRASSVEVLSPAFISVRTIKKSDLDSISHLVSFQIKSEKQYHTGALLGPAPKLPDVDTSERDRLFSELEHLKRTNGDPLMIKKLEEALDALLEGKLFVLVRYISGYSGSDRLLGIFTTAERAEQAKKKYIEANKENDPWAEQGYRDDVDMEKDIVIVDDVPTSSVRGNKAYLLCAYSQGFGQSAREFVSLFGDLESAKREQKREAQEEKGWPSHFLVTEVPLNRLLPEEEQDDEDRAYNEGIIGGDFGEEGSG